MATEVNTANAIGLTEEGCSRVTLWITTAFHLDTPTNDLTPFASTRGSYLYYTNFAETADDTMSMALRLKWITRSNG
jgi:hypothetical protein